jgi:diacylglycerol O-acyltransferase
LVDLAVSNIPGSRDPLYLWNSRLLRLYPFVTGVGNIALIVGVLSYADELGVGITVDPDVVGDPQRILDHVRAATTELTNFVR